MANEMDELILDEAMLEGVKDNPALGYPTCRIELVKCVQGLSTHPDTSSVPNGPGGPVSGQNWPGPRVTGQADERPISTGFTLVETMGDWANHGS